MRAAPDPPGGDDAQLRTPPRNLLSSATPTLRSCGTPPTNPDRPKRIVVGTSFDRASAVALKRGTSLAHALGLELVVVHVLDKTSPCRRHETRAARRCVREWALFEARVPLAPEAVSIRVGDAIDELHRAYDRWRGEILVIGGRGRPSGPPPGRRTRALIARARGPVLVAGQTRSQPSVVAATDLAREEVPVVHAAARLARQLKANLTIVHNLHGVTLDGRRFPLPKMSEDRLVASRLEALETVVRNVPHVSEATFTRDSDAVQSILRVARERDVDLVVVGARPNRGATIAKVLADAQRSVLTIPLLR